MYIPHTHMHVNFPWNDFLDARSHLTNKINPLDGLSFLKKSSFLHHGPLLSWMPLHQRVFCKLDSSYARTVWFDGAWSDSLINISLRPNCAKSHVLNLPSPLPLDDWGGFHFVFQATSMSSSRLKWHKDFLVVVTFLHRWIQQTNTRIRQGASSVCMSVRHLFSDNYPLYYQA